MGVKKKNTGYLLDNCKKCKQCAYALRSRGFNHTICNYICVTGHMRGCDPGDKCTKFKKEEE